MGLSFEYRLKADDPELFIAFSSRLAVVVFGLRCLDALYLVHSLRT